MALNANIILQGQQPDFVNTLARATQAADAQNGAMRRNSLADLYSQQGDRIAQGDQGALNELARLDPVQAQGIAANNLGMQQTQQTMARMSAQEERAVATYAAGISAAERAAASAKLQDGVRMGLSATNPDQWDQIAQSAGAPELVGQFANRDAWINKFRTMDEIIKASEPKAPLSPEGKLRRDIDNGILGENAAAPKVDPKAVQELRKEVNAIPAVKAFSEQSQAFGRIVASAKNPSPAGDLALIFNYMKVLDPGSVVRESEFKTAADASAWLQRSEQLGIDVPLPIAQGIRAMATGNRLGAEQRADFVGRAEALYSGAEQNYGQIVQQYSDIASRQGIPINDIIINYRYSGDAPSLVPDAAQPETPATSVLTPEEQALYEKYN